VPDAEYLFMIFGYFKSFDLTYNGDKFGHEVGHGDGGTLDHYRGTFGECPPTPICPDSIVKVVIFFDRYPQETTWTLTNNCDGEEVASGGPYAYSQEYTRFSQRICVPDAEYLFVISDSAGDGICCDNGEGISYITYNGDKVGQQGKDFGSSDEKTFGECESLDLVVAEYDAPRQVSK